MKVIMNLVGWLVVFILVQNCAAQTEPNVTICKQAVDEMATKTPTLFAQMLDYTGKAIDDMGNYDGCMDLPNTIHYCVAQTEVGIGKANEHVMIYMGLCYPSQCTDEMLRILIVDTINNTANAIKFPFPLNNQMANLKVHCVDRGRYVVSWGAKVAIALFSVIAVLVVSGTLLEYIEAQMAVRMVDRMTINGPYINEKERRPLVNNEGVDPNRLSIDEANHPLSAPHVTITGDAAIPRRRPGKFAEFLKCFAIGSNLAFLLKDNRASEPGLAAMNGLRCLMMFWIILGHTFTYLSAPVGFDNAAFVTQHLIERVSFQVVSAAELAVDVFFYLSGFLVVYMVLKELKNSKRKGIPWGLFYFHRYWRLTPVYGLIILFYTTVTPYFIYGPFSYLYRQAKTDNCDRYWWTNLIYINNFYPTNSNEQCFGWGWYLANDMQFFILSPAIIFLYRKNKIAAGATIGALTVVCIFLDGYLTWVHKLKPLDPGDASWNSIVYNKPYTRMAPYLIGIGFAFLVQIEHLDLLRNRYIRWAVYIVSIIGTTCSTYLTYGFWRGDGWHTWQNVLYAASARCVFVSGAAVFMYACFKGHGGVLKDMLSVYMWVPIGRLTYTAYLTHPIIMFVINYNTTTNFHYSAIYAAVRYSSHLFLAYVCGLIFHLAIEKPTANVERIFLPAKKH